ncbi:MAG TPA: SlyX family protein [Opitutaceae bacterium]|nr:SlyX family protein [Opitutaceae bacterium]
MSDRQAELEIKIAWLERHVTEQDKAMLELHEDMARLRRELLALKGRLESGAPDDGNVAQDERPPHY